LKGAEQTCRSCNEQHSGMVDLASVAPGPWPRAIALEPNSVIRLGGDFLSGDFCVHELG